MGHHFVPQRYLRNFEDPSRPGFIWLHDKVGGAGRLVPIKKVAQAKGFYSAETEASLASEVEAPGNAAIRKLRGDTAITPVERLQLAYYIGVMLKRIPARRRRSSEMIPGVLADVASQVRDQLKAVASAVQADPELLAQRLREVDAAENTFASQPPPEVLEQIREPWASEAMLRALFGMTWRVLISSGPQYFIATDNPVFFFGAYGLARKESELAFPLSTTHALHGSWRSAGSDLVFLRTTQTIVKEINRRLASEAERLVFYHEPAPWLLKILPKKKPYLSVIRWPDEPPNPGIQPPAAKSSGGRLMPESLARFRRT
jgi:hypothetical protein